MKFILSLLIFIFVLNNGVEAGFIFHDGKFTNAKYFAKDGMEVHYQRGRDAFESKHWKASIAEFKSVVTTFPDEYLPSDSYYYLAVSYYEVGDYDLADTYFDVYLRLYGSDNRFKQIWEYKYLIAEKYRLGIKKHLFGLEVLPKWSLAKDEALDIYEIIISTFPLTDLSAKALFAKGELLLDLKDYEGSRDCFEEFIFKYPLDVNIPEAYLLVAKSYKEDVLEKDDDPDLLVLAKINLTDFKERFSGDKRLIEAQKYYNDMEEYYAEKLFLMGEFYEKIKQPKGAIVYYYNSLKRYPNTKVSQKVNKRLTELQNHFKDLGIEEY